MVNNISWRRLYPQNTSNPEDNIGLWHNEILGFVLENQFKISKDFTNEIKVITDLAKIIIPKAVELTSSSPSIREIDQGFSAVITAAIQVEGYSNEYFTGEKEDSEFVEIYSDIITTVFKLTESTTKTVIDELKDIDTDIQNSSLSAGDKTILYQVNSIARYSSAYWIAESQNHNSVWLDINPSDQSGFKKGDPPDWVLADIGGALVGALLTANPFIALAGGAGSSAWDVLTDALH